MGKKDKKTKKHVDSSADNYDYSDIEYSGDIRQMMRESADNLKVFLDYIEVYLIYEGMTSDQWKKTKRGLKKLIKKLRKGDPSVYDVTELNEYLRQCDRHSDGRM